MVTIFHQEDKRLQQQFLKAKELKKKKNTIINIMMKPNQTLLLLTPMILLIKN